MKICYAVEILVLSMCAEKLMEPVTKFDNVGFYYGQITGRNPLMLSGPGGM